MNILSSPKTKVHPMVEVEDSNMKPLNLKAEKVPKPKIVSPDVKKKKPDQGPPLTPREEAVRQLQENETIDEKIDQRGFTAFIKAVCDCDTQKAKLLLKYGADINKEDEDGYTALSLVCSAGNNEMASFLIDNKADPDVIDHRGGAALIHAAKNGHENTVEFLLTTSSNPNIQDQGGDSALITASKFGHDGVVKVLMKHEVDDTLKDKSGKTALDWARELNEPLCIRLLDKELEARERAKALEKTPEELAVVKMFNNEQVNALMLDHGHKVWPIILAVLNNQEARLGFLIKYGAKLNVQDEFGKTALFEAAALGYAPLLKILLQAKADPNIANEDGLTPLDIAKEENHEECVAILEDIKSAEIEREVKALADANKINDIFMIDGVSDEHGYTPLTISAGDGDSLRVKHLLKHGADVNHTDNEGATALMRAARYGHVDIVQMLIENKANLEAQATDDSGMTALILAVKWNRHNVVKLLVGANADITIQDKRGKTALDYAKDNNRVECVAHLENANQK